MVSCGDVACCAGDSVSCDDGSKEALAGVCCCDNGSRTVGVGTVLLALGGGDGGDSIASGGRKYH